LVTCDQFLMSIETLILNKVKFYYRNINNTNENKPQEKFSEMEGEFL
jgi:hypothetical protein